MKDPNEHIIELRSEHLRSAFRSLRVWWVLIPLFVVLAIVSTDQLLPDEYEATTVLAPSEERGGGLSDMLGGLGGLGSLAGLDIGGQKLNNTQLAVELLKSRAFLYDVINKYDMHAPLVGGKGLNDSEELIIDKEEVANRPQIWQAYNELRERYVVNYDRAAGIVTLNLTFYSPEAAARWLEVIVAEINEIMRKREREQIFNSIDYLTQKAQETDIAEVRRAIYNLLQEQYKQAMLVAVKKDHVFETIDPPFKPHSPAGFSLTVKLVAGIMFSVFVMILLTLLVGYRRARYTS